MYSILIRMALQFIHIFQCLKLFLIIWTYVDNTNSICLSDLKQICVIDNGVSSINSLGNTSQYCTAISSIGSNSRTSKNSISLLRGNLPYLKIYDNEGHKEMSAHIYSESSMTSFITQLETMICDEKIDALAFDNFESDLPMMSINMSYQKRLRDFFIMLNKKFPDLLFGLLISKNKNKLKYAYVPSVLKESVQFYMVRSLSYHRCKRKSHQRNMKNTSPVNSMERTIQRLKNHEFDLSNVILVIRIVVNNVLTLKSSGKDDTSYTTHCSTNLPNDWAKYCAETLEGFNAKGKLVYRYKMLGAFIQCIDQDDYGNKCECGAFAALIAITTGMNGSPQVEDCQTWGLLPREKSKTNGTGK